LFSSLAAKVVKGEMSIADELGDWKEIEHETTALLEAIYQ